jgi:hypothetical protein
MLLRIALLVAAIGVVYWIWLRGLPAARRRGALRYTLLVVLGAVLVGLALSGRAHWLFGLLGGLLPFARSLLMRLVQMKLFQWLSRQTLSRQAAAAAAKPGRHSEVVTDTLRMYLDHDSGELSGEVLRGRFAGRTLDTLGFDELLALRTECAASDPQGAALLENYLERMHAEAWLAYRESAGATGRQAVPPDSGSMSEVEARQVLGVGPEADRQEIRDAHRRLMQRLHPDRGGSSFLAAQINRAKDRLLGA